MRVLFVLLVFLFLPLSCSCAAPQFDPWYYQSDRDPRFIIPDKAQHYYGSQALTLLTDNVALVLASGVLKEVYDNSRGTGFSYRDLIADGLGILAASLHSDRFVMCLTWQKPTREMLLSLHCTF